MHAAAERRPGAEAEMNLRKALEALPKVELHRHLEGSLRLSTIAEIASGRLDLPTDPERLKALLQVSPNSPKPPHQFLGIFRTLRNLFLSPEIIQRVASEAVEDAAKEGVRYLELRFTPSALSEARGFALGEVMDWVLEAAMDAARPLGIGVRLLASANRHEPVEIAEQVASLAVDRMGCGVVGLDLAGNESEHPAEPFAGVLRSAREAGLHLTVHAGEWSGPHEVCYALEVLEAERIGHGIRALEDPNTVALALDRNAVFEVAPTSNLCTGVVSRLEEHPLLDMIQAGLRVTIGTDDPGIFGISLADEYAATIEHMGLSLETVKGMVLTAAQGAFLPAREKRDLEQELVKSLWAGEGGA